MNMTFTINVRLMKKIGSIAALIIIIGALCGYISYSKDRNAAPKGFVMGNGRVEATEIDIATKYPGSLCQVLVREGDKVKADQVVAKMDTSTLEAQLMQAEAEIQRARQARKTAISRVRESESRLDLAYRELERSQRLVAKGFITRQKYDYDQTATESFEAQNAAASAMVGEAGAAVESASALAKRLRAEINDCILKSPRNGQVMSRLAEPGAVLGAGGKILTIIDREDMYMNVFLPANAAGTITVGSDARVVPDAFPNENIPAKVTFISEKAQFTPREVEATEERQKLVFRVKVHLLSGEDKRLKPGLPGITYVRVDPAASWSGITR
jgi:HlyD family secretion protein